MWGTRSRQFRDALQYFSGVPVCSTRPSGPTKMRRHAERDHRSTQLAQDHGWHVVRVWECQVRRDPDVVAHTITSPLDRRSFVALTGTCANPKGLTIRISLSRKLLGPVRISLLPSVVERLDVRPKRHAGAGVI